jgi:gluconate 5-dehydrogenase
MSTTVFDLAGRRALITGSARGIGLALARGLASAGAAIVLNGRDRDRLEITASQLRSEGHSVATAVFDVTEPEAVAAAIGKVEQDIGPIEILVNNAGIQRRMPLEDFPIEAWREIIRANLDSIFFVAQAVARGMIARGPAARSSISARSRANSRAPASHPTRRPKGP